jgi:hypothetical protein
MSDTKSEGAAWAAANDDKCFFCEGEYPGYALKDKDGAFKPACWGCANGGANTVTTVA